MLYLDVSTRWNNTYLMLDVALKYEKAFEAYEDVDRMFRTKMLAADGCLDRDDWEKVRKFYSFLKKFYDVTVKISRSAYITSNMCLDDICHVYGTIKSWLSEDDLELRMMAEKMKKKYDKYWGDKNVNEEKLNLMMFVIAVLDLGLCAFCC